MLAVECGWIPRDQSRKPAFSNFLKRRKQQTLKIDLYWSIKKI
jgi:hypothetical protein